MGKDEPRVTNKRLAAAAGILDSVPDSVASGEGLENGLLGRCLFIETDQFRPLAEPAKADLPASCVATARMMAEKELKFNETAYLEPVIVTDGGEKWRIDSILQKRPVQTYDWIPSEGECLASVAGYMPEVHTAVADEGVWIEDDEGVRLVTGEIVQTDCGLTEFTLKGPIPSGNHWFVLQGRLKDSPNLIRVRRRIKVA